MKLFEFYEANDNKLVKQKPNDTRKVRLTLRHLNKLRKMQEIKKVDLLKPAAALPSFLSFENFSVYWLSFF